MKKVLTPLANAVLVLFFLSTFGWLIKSITQGEKLLGDTTSDALLSFVSFFDLFEETVEEVQKLPETFVPTPTDFEPVNKLDEDLFALVSYSNKRKQRRVELRNLKNDSILISWNIKNKQQEHDRIMDPLLLPNKTLVYSFNGVTGLFALDSTGKKLWHQDTIVHHHAMNLDSAGNIWACSYTEEDHWYIIYQGLYRSDETEIRYIDNSVSRLDPNTGEVTFHKSISEILRDNNLSNLIIKSSSLDDPLHLNDVQPALKTTAYYKEGDLFLSLRNISTILHYRPSTNKILEVIDGIFYCQHDVDFLDDHTIYFFNNNGHTIRPKTPTNWPIGTKIQDLGTFYSNIMAYDLATKEFYYLEDSSFSDNEIFTLTEGMSEVLENGNVFVEEQNSGLLWVLKEGQVIYKNVLPSQHEGHHHLPNWTRIIKDFN
tara:strand:- start:6228 stop:7514 length:1287 start_codon:yes stop_codon:yes gene_type:complete